MFTSSIIEETEKVLQEVLETIRQEVERSNSVLCETDRREFIKEEGRLSVLLKETSSGSQSSVWGLLGLASPRAKKCLEDAKALRRRVKEDIDENIRTRLSGESSPPSSNREPGSAVDPTNAWGAEADSIRPSLAEGNSESANPSTEITSPAHPRFSLPELSGLNINDVPTTGQEAHDHRSDLFEAIDTRVSSDRSSSSSNGRRRRTPPPPPSPRRMAQLSDSEGNDSSSGRYRRTPPQADVPHTANARARRGSRRDESCLTFVNSKTIGTTVNSDSTHCSGAVIHTVMLPPRSSRPASQF